MRGYHSRLLVAGLGLCVAGLAVAKSPETNRDAQQGAQQVQPQSGHGPDRLASAAGVQTLSHQDRRFIEQALAQGIAEVREAMLAQRQAASPDVRRAADRLQQDHSLSNTELERMAAAHGVVATKEPSDDRKARYSRLRSLSGATFDKEYLRGQVSACTQSIQLYQHAQIESTNRTVKTFATTMLPRLKGHLAMIETAQEKGNAAENRKTSGSALNEPVNAQPVNTQPPQ